MEKLEIAGQEREQLARHNALLEKAIIARDRVSADFKEAKTAGGGSYGLEEPKVCCIQSSLLYIVVYEEDKKASGQLCQSMLLEKAFIAQDRVSADFTKTKAVGEGSYGLQSPRCCTCDAYCCNLCIKLCDSWDLGPSLERSHMLWQYDCAQGCPGG